MDASSYLRKLGWRGEGHPLDQRGNGIKKALLVSKKVDALGIGLNKHAAVTDQWWLRAFDEGLKSIGKEQETALGGAQKHGVKRGGLYGRFTKGEGVPGTIEPTSIKSTSIATITPSVTAEQYSTEMAANASSQENPRKVTNQSNNAINQNVPVVLAKDPIHAPAGVDTKPNRKRKLEEGPAEKRARRKIERSERSKHASEDAKRQAIENGTWDYEAEKERRRMEGINRQARQFVYEAQRQGIIPVGPSDRLPHRDSFNGARAELNTSLSQIISSAGLNNQAKPKGSGKRSLKAEKYEREKMKRELKRAAKAYLMGEPPPTKNKMRKNRKKERNQPEAKAKRLEKAKLAAERLKRQEERALQKREARAKRRAGNKEVGKLVAEREDAAAAEVTVQENYPEHERAHIAAELEHRNQAVNEVYNSVHKAKVEVQGSKFEKEGLSPEKLEQYTKRAAEKGVSLEKYIKRRNEKHAAKVGKRLVDPIQEAVLGSAQQGADYIPLDSDPPLGFIIDTAGDESLVTAKGDRSLVTANINSDDFATQATSAVRQARPLAILNDEGNEILRWTPGTPVPVEPRIWVGIKPKLLPRPVRKARQVHMRIKREERKARKSEQGGTTAAEKKKSRAQRKIEAREAFVMQILRESRNAVKEGRTSGMVTIEGVDNVPLVKVETAEGKFKKHELSLARTAARRVLRHAKREERARQGKGKGWRKKLPKQEIKWRAKKKAPSNKDSIT